MNNSQKANWIEYLYVWLSNTSLLACISSIIIGLPTIVYYIRIDCTIFAIYILLLSYVIAFILSAILCINNKAIQILNFSILALLLLSSSTSLFGQLAFGQLLPIDAIAAVAQTNYHETLEFLQSNHVGIILAIVVYFVLLYGIWHIINHNIIPQKLTKPLSLSCICILLISILACFHNPDVISCFKKCNDINDITENSVDLRNYATYPIVCESIQSHPDNIIIVIGESYTKFHSSLYGYEKETNPKLKQLTKDSTLIVFENVESPCTSTTPTFKFILNTNTRERKSQWYKSTTIIESFRTLGYHTTWISNQQQFGVWNNISSGQSVLCDETYFHGGEGQDMDMIVVETYKKIKHTKGKNLYIFHLYGQHPEFCKRYPKEFEHFFIDDYSTPNNQKAFFAAYDNATLYNDNVVSSIFSCFEDKDAIVVYFADHGIDFFYTDPNYCAHGKPNIAESDSLSRQIPFLVYTPEKFKNKHPELVKTIKELKDIPFCTESFIFHLMSFTGYRLEKYD